MPYKVDSGVKKSSASKGKAKYPFADMGVNDSFFVPSSDSSPQSVLQSAYQYGVRSGKKFSGERREEAVGNKKVKGVRIWRVE